MAKNMTHYTSAQVKAILIAGKTFKGKERLRRFKAIAKAWNKAPSSILSKFYSAKKLAKPAKVKTKLVHLKPKENVKVGNGEMRIPISSIKIVGHELVINY